MANTIEDLSRHCQRDVLFAQTSNSLSLSLSLSVCVCVALYVVSLLTLSLFSF